MNFFKVMFTLLLMLLAGCGSVPVEEYRDERPALDLRRYLTAPSMPGACSRIAVASW